MSSSEAVSNEEEQKGLSYFRTSQSCPLQHDQRHLGRIFTMDQDSLDVHGVGNKERFPNWMVRTEFVEHQQALNEHAFLLRAPMLEATQYLKQVKVRRETTPSTDKGANSLKIIFWGEDGCGKKTSLLYTTDYCHREGYIILNFFKFRQWYFHYKEMQESNWKEGRYDHITRSQVFLKEFLNFNKDKIAHLKTHADYSWSAREKTETGSPLLSVVETGITRPVVAADALGVLLKELRLHCEDAVSRGEPDSCKVALVIDGMSKLFVERSYIDRKMPERPKKGPFKQDFIDESIAPNELSVVRNIKKMLNPSLPNRVVIGSADIVDVISIRGVKYVDQLVDKMIPETQSYYPFALLGQEGWEALNPFIPIEVGRYTKAEMDTIIDYHLERNYLQPVAATEPGRAEIHFMSARHPLDFMKFCPEW